MNWKTANKKQREKLLELIRRLAEDDKDGVMAHKVPRFYIARVNCIVCLFRGLIVIYSVFPRTLGVNSFLESGPF